MEQIDSSEWRGDWRGWGEINERTYMHTNPQTRTIAWGRHWVRWELGGGRQKGGKGDKCNTVNNNLI